MCGGLFVEPVRRHIYGDLTGSVKSRGPRTRTAKDFAFKRVRVRVHGRNLCVVVRRRVFEFRCESGGSASVDSDHRRVARRR